MSAIVGMYFLDGRRAEQADIERMTASLSRRGPDGQGIWREESVALGSRVLWTTPESIGERLPWSDQPGDWVITADARLDNREELVRLLDLGERQVPGRGDAALILEAYRRWGTSCARYLLGDFAFAIWDRRTRTLFCARDPFGVKPFVYFHRPGRVFAFASEIPALHCLEDVPRRLNERRVAFHLVMRFDDPVNTAYEEIVRLPPAHSLIVSPGETRLERYWSPDRSRVLKLGSDEEYAEALREVFDEAVRCRLRSAYPIGSMLSGGLDSSSVACTARELLSAGDPAPGNARLHTFSAIFPDVAAVDPQIDERRFINAVVSTGDVAHHWVRADRENPLGDFLWRGAEPIPAFNLYMDHAVFQAAREQGVRVILSGTDGDSTISYGYESLPMLARTGHWKALWSECSALARVHGAKRRDVLWSMAVLPLLPKDLARAGERVRGTLPPAWPENWPISPRFAERIELERALRGMEAPQTWNPREEHWRGVSNGLLTYVLELLDAVSVPARLEVRYPFFDRRLVEFCLSVPPSQVLQQGVTRSIMRRAMGHRLPPEVLGRLGKGNLGANFRCQLIERERATIEQVISDEDGILAEYVDLPTARAAFERYASRPADGRSDVEATSIFPAVVLGLWLRHTELIPRGSSIALASPRSTIVSV